MKALNEIASKTFYFLINQLKNKDFVTISKANGDYLSITRLAHLDEVVCFRPCKAFNIAYYSHASNTLYPDMCFYQNTNNNEIYAFYFLRSNEALNEKSEEISIVPPRGEFYKMHERHTDFANAWLSNLRDEFAIKDEK